MDIKKLQDKGFTLIELILVIILLGIVATTGIILVDKILNQASFDATKKTMENIRTAIMGNRELGTGGETSATTKVSYGYFGDVGARPTVNTGTNDLITRPGTVSAWAFNPAGAGCTVNGVAQSCNAGSGWNGPYMQSTFTGQSAINDGWGNVVVVDISTAVGTDPAVRISSSSTGAPAALVVNWNEIMAIGATNPLTVNVSNGGMNLSYAGVTAYYPDGAGGITATQITGNNTAGRGQAGNYIFNAVNIPYGSRSVMATMSGATYGPAQFMAGGDAVRIDMTGLMSAGSGGGLVQTGGAGFGATVALTGVVTNANFANITIQSVQITWTGGATMSVGALGITFTGSGAITDTGCAANACTKTFATAVTLAPNTGPAAFTLTFSAAMTSANNIRVKMFDAAGNNMGNFVIY